MTPSASFTKPGDEQAKKALHEIRAHILAAIPDAGHPLVNGLLFAALFGALRSEAVARESSTIGDGTDEDAVNTHNLLEAAAECVVECVVDPALVERFVDKLEKSGIAQVLESVLPVFD